MSEPIIEPTAAELTAELEVLRKTNSELLKKIHDRTTKAAAHGVPRTATWGRR